MRLNPTNLLAPIAVFAIHCGGSTQEAHAEGSTPDGGGSSDSGPSGNGDGGHDSGVPSIDSGPPPEGFVASFIQGNSTAPQLCPFGSRDTWLDVGSAANGLSPMTLSDGSAQRGERVSLACTVHPVSGGYDVQLSAGLSGSGSLTIVSRSGPVDAVSGGQAVTGTFESGSLGSYTSSSCTIAFTVDGAPVPVSPPIAPGRIWGHLSCPNAQRMDLLIRLPDGGTTSPTCDAEADFLFENCRQ